MLKKINVFIIVAIISILPSFAKVDKTSSEYLKDKKHFALMNPLAESVAQRAIKKVLKKETGENFKVKFDGYTLSSMKSGIFKNLEIIGKDVKIEGVDVKYLRLKSASDYNWIDYTQKPLLIKTDMMYDYEIYLTEDGINQALDNKEYKKTLAKVNGIAYPLFVINDTQVKVKNDRLYLILDYNFPISPSKKNKTFVVSTGFKVENNKIKASNVNIDKAYGNLQGSKVANLINLLDPLSFTLDIVNKKDCNGRVENVKIVDGIVQISGRIFVKGE